MRKQISLPKNILKSRKFFFQISDTTFTPPFPPLKFCTPTSVMIISEGSNRYPGNFFPKRVPILLKTRETDTHWIPLSSSTLQPISYFLFSNTSRHDRTWYYDWIRQTFGGVSINEKIWSIIWVHWKRRVRLWTRHFNNLNWFIFR